MTIVLLDQYGMGTSSLIIEKQSISLILLSRHDVTPLRLIIFNLFGYFSMLGFF